MGRRQNPPGYRLHEEAQALLNFFGKDVAAHLLANGISTMHPAFHLFLGITATMTYPGVSTDRASQIIYVLFLGPTLNQISSIATTHPSYLYYFTRKPDGDVPYSYNWGEFPAVDWGAEHGMEMGYVFGHMSTPGVPGNSYDTVSQADRVIGRAVNQAWVTLAKTGYYTYLSNN